MTNRIKQGNNDLLLFSYIATFGPHLPRVAPTTESAGPYGKDHELGRLVQAKREV